MKLVYYYNRKAFQGVLWDGGCTLFLDWITG